MFRVILIILLKFQFVAANTCNFYSNNKSQNHTVEFINVINNCDSVILNEGVYFFDFDKIFLKPNFIVSTKGEVKIYAVKNKKLSKTNPSAIFTSVNPTNLKLSNIKFFDVGNRAYAIKIINNNIQFKLNSNIEISNNSTEKIGLLWVGPRGGFTYNRLNKNNINPSWYENGPIVKNNWNSTIKVENNIIIGASRFYSGNFEKNNSWVGVSAITLLFANNIIVRCNTISNYRFGIWVYGGASLDRERKKVLLSSHLCKNIYISENRIFETYSPIWFSKAANIQVSYNYCKNNQDVAIDFEGSYNASVDNNIVINSRGGALTVLNGSENISFFNNVIEMKNFNRNNNIVLIRNSNQNIKYSNNEFIFHDNRILKKNARIMLIKEDINFKPNSQIEFLNNTLLGVEIENRDGSSLIIKN